MTDYYDDDEYVSPARKRWEERQAKDVRIGFICLGLMLLCVVGAIVWFFA